MTESIIEIDDYGAYKALNTAHVVLTMIKLLPKSKILPNNFLKFV